MNAKAVLGFFADILYIKGLICFDEFDAIMNAKHDVDLGVIVERMLTSDFNLYKRGESYGTLIK
jgi:hypothetical protein